MCGSRKHSYPLCHGWQFEIPNPGMYEAELQFTQDMCLKTKKSSVVE